MTCLMPLAKVHDPAAALDFLGPPGVAAATVAPIAASVTAAAATAIASPFLPISIPPLMFDARNLRHRRAARESNGFRTGYTAERLRAGRNPCARTFARASARTPRAPSRLRARAWTAA